MILCILTFANNAKDRILSSSMDTDTPERPNSRRENKGRSSPSEILVSEVMERASRSNATLREHLTGAVLVEVTDTSERYFIDWRGGEISAKSIERGAAAEADCAISLTSKDLSRIASGDVNPQIAMVSDRVKVSGKPGLAVYFFNLVAPRSGG